MIYILSRTTKKHQKTLSRPLHSKLKKIQGLFKDLHRNLRTFQGKWISRTFQGLSLKFKYFSRLCEPCLSGLINLINFGCAVLARAAGTPSINNRGFLFQWSRLVLIACCLSQDPPMHFSWAAPLLSEHIITEFIHALFVSYSIARIRGGGGEATSHTFS